MKIYVTLKIREGDYNIKCPGANCKEGELALKELQSLVEPDLYQLHIKFKINLGVFT